MSPFSLAKPPFALSAGHSGDFLKGEPCVPNPPASLLYVTFSIFLFFFIGALLSSYLQLLFLDGVPFVQCVSFSIGWPIPFGTEAPFYSSFSSALLTFALAGKPALVPDRLFLNGSLPSRFPSEHNVSPTLRAGRRSLPGPCRAVMEIPLSL